MNSNRSSVLPMPANHSKTCMSAARKCYKYMRRMLKFDQMDFEFALWQMLYLFVSPQKVYRNFQYRKQNKSQFARDDPAFLVLFSSWLCVTSIGFAIVLRLGFLQFLHFLLYVVFVDCIGAGLLIASMFWYLTGFDFEHRNLHLIIENFRFILNKYLRINVHDQDVEWGYAFDVHLNAFFPPLTILHFCQLFFYNVLGLISHDWFASRFLGNTFWLIACSYYIYITFLGYSALKFLRRTRFILSPIPVLFIFYVVSLTGGFNITHWLMNYYRDRVV